MVDNLFLCFTFSFFGHQIPYFSNSLFLIVSERQFETNITFATIPYKNIDRNSFIEISAFTKTLHEGGVFREVLRTCAQIALFLMFVLLESAYI